MSMDSGARTTNASTWDCSVNDALAERGASASRTPRLRTNFVAMMMWQIGNYLVPLATFPYLTRVLGAAHFGVLAYATAVATYGMLVTEWGFFLSGPKAVVECRGEPDALNELVWSTMAAKACLCAASLAALLVVARFDTHIAAAFPVMLAACLTVVANVFTLNWLLQGLERFAVFSTVSLAGRFLSLPLTFLFVRTRDDLAIAAAIQGMAAVMTGLFSVIAARRLGVLRRPRLSIRSVWQRLRESADMFVSSASVSLLGLTNSVILGSTASVYQVGLYTAADRLKTMANMVPAQVNTVFYPRVAALSLSDPRKAAQLTAIGAAATLMLTVAGVAALTWLAVPLTALVLGSGYEGSAPVLRLLCLATVFGNVAYFVGLQVLVPFGETRKRSISMLAAGVLNVVLALVLTPRYGAIGAAVSFLIAEIAIAAVYVFIVLSSPVLRRHFSQLMTHAR